MVRSDGGEELGQALVESAAVAETGQQEIASEPQGRAFCWRWNRAVTGLGVVFQAMGWCPRRRRREKRAVDLGWNPQERECL